MGSFSESVALEISKTHLFWADAKGMYFRYFLKCQGPTWFLTLKKLFMYNWLVLSDRHEQKMAIFPTK